MVIVSLQLHAHSFCRANSEPSHVNSADNANDIDSVDQQVDDSFVESRAQNRKGRKTTEFWEVRIIDSNGTIKPVRLSVKEAMERPNGRKIVLRSTMQSKQLETKLDC
ncbi:hypothetical protein Ahy_B01g052693 isoform A [Arachis hypogaea]|uniref:Uncharacterized protein n=1 Tax=Arachis hypogaea TaxID=3818 RepID=A0A445AQ39_ARAHY|nr:hypothetical protein Ahy_B01g052693 isoform A [Arachis hypogaea]